MSDMTEETMKELTPEYRLYFILWKSLVLDGNINIIAVGKGKGPFKNSVVAKYKS